MITILYYILRKILTYLHTYPPPPPPPPQQHLIPKEYRTFIFFHLTYLAFI